MTDNDIIKALEHCIKCNQRQIANCNGCLFERIYPECDTEIEVMCLDLINRLKAEIERLKAENRKLSEVNNSLNYQVDVWNPTEVIKKFADKLKEKAYPFPCAIGVEYAVSIRAINDTVEEMLVEKVTEEET